MNCCKIATKDFEKEVLKSSQKNTLQIVNGIANGY